MIIVRLMGGLGNQLFQYAACLNLAHHHGVPLKLDISWFDSQTKRRFRLNRFNISASCATRDEVANFTFTNQNYLIRNIIRFSQRFRPCYRRTVFKQPKGSYDPNFLKTPQNAYLVGYWQSERYFKDVADILRKEFTLKNPLCQANKNMLSLIQGTDSISIHVRRGDYVTNAATHNYHGICSSDYYSQAIENINQRVVNPHYFVFSDDMEWVKRNLDLKRPTQYVSQNKRERDYEDLYLMSQCKYHIIANSSFSWWGAWLSGFPGKIVIAPEKWFNDPKKDTSDLLPDSWLRI